MCNFFSAIVLRNGDVLHHPMIDSHSSLVKLFNLRDDDAARVDRFAKVEFRPDAGCDWLDPKTWTLDVDEQTEPDWFPEIRGRVRSRLEAIVEGFIVRDDKQSVAVGTSLILTPEARIRQAVRCVVRFAEGANLSGASLSGASLSGANLSGANLSGASLSGAYLSEANLSEANLSRANLSRADLSRADLSRAYLSRANLSGANLSGAYRGSSSPVSGYTVTVTGFLQPVPAPTV